MRGLKFDLGFAMSVWSLTVMLSWTLFTTAPAAAAGVDGQQEAQHGLGPLDWYGVDTVTTPDMLYELVFDVPWVAPPADDEPYHVASNVHIKDNALITIDPATEEQVGVTWIERDRIDMELIDAQGINEPWWINTDSALVAGLAVVPDVGTLPIIGWSFTFQHRAEPELEETVFSMLFKVDVFGNEIGVLPWIAGMLNGDEWWHEERAYGEQDYVIDKIAPPSETCLRNWKNCLDECKIDFGPAIGAAVAAKLGCLYKCSVGSATCFFWGPFGYISCKVVCAAVCLAAFGIIIATLIDALSTCKGICHRNRAGCQPGWQPPYII